MRGATAACLKTLALPARYSPPMENWSHLPCQLSNMAPARPSRPESGFGCQVTVFKKLRCSRFAWGWKTKAFNVGRYRRMLEDPGTSGKVS